MTGPMRFIGSLCLLWVLAACSELPRGAAVDTEILKTSSDVEADFAIYPVTKAFLPSIQNWPSVGDEHYTWIGATKGSNSQVISAGDTLNIRIWDSGENSLLTAAGSPVADLTAVRVTSAGTVFIPYVGKVNVAGRTPDSARSVIQNSLEEVVPSAQVQVTMAEGRLNSVDLVGGVRAPGAFAMPDQNFSVLSLIAAGGGVDGSLKNPQIRLMRGGDIYGTSMDRLYENPGDDTRLRGGDKVIVEADERYFVSMGAAGNQSLHPFTKDQITATDAVAILGGVNPARANPKGILILREYPASAVRPGVRGPRQPRVVFTLDLTNADGLFSARNFLINSGDVVLVTESPVNGARTVLGLVGSVFGVVNTVGNARN
ncbi:polysaccharide biosynthesis/export family protein [Pseudosulfitobacter koreensis]|uniref:Polysaccharide export protein n=1 Tax=Pseudosulfitobacter koreensis TaxID=2968472 RepID=A0ABT1Z0Y3_9RHOB|nr:polysaccharide biosynthesis/export family protein [Pseudosulfitobacter koreense]MCR8826777.1 polysaccharide export protein [Pseudosulfitobacter koreense]